MRHLKQLFAALLMLSPIAANADVITFTNEAAWVAALGGATTTTETLDGAASSFAANSTGNVIGSGLTLDLIGPAVGNDTGPTGSTGHGQLQFEVDGGGGDALDILINGPQMIGFALLNLTDDSLTSPEGKLHELGVLVAGSGFLISDILGISTDVSGQTQLTRRGGAVHWLHFHHRI